MQEINNTELQSVNGGLCVGACVGVGILCLIFICCY